MVSSYNLLLIDSCPFYSNHTWQKGKESLWGPVCTRLAGQCQSQRHLPWWCPCNGAMGGVSRERDGASGKGERDLSLGAERPHSPRMGSAAAPNAAPWGGMLGRATPVWDTAGTVRRWRAQAGPTTRVHSPGLCLCIGLFLCPPPPALEATLTC